MKLLILIMFPFVAMGQSNLNFDIFESVRKGNLIQVKHILNQNPKIADSLNNHNHSLLIIAAYYEQQEILEYMLPLVSNINHKSENGTALAAAVVKNNFYIINTLLEYNANVNLTDAKGVSPLMYAILFKNTKVINLLLKHGADKSALDNTGKSTFEYAVSTGDQNIINLLKN